MSIPKVKRYENGKEITGQVDTPYEITWDDWQLLTDAEKEKRKWLITDVPSADGFITVENMKLLWSNPNPTSAFASQNITLSSADYDFLMCEVTEAGIAMQEKGKIVYAFLAHGSAGTPQNFFRYFNPVNATTITISNTFFNGNESTAHNGSLIPQKIYGMKLQTEIRFNALANNVKSTVDYSTDEHPIGTWIDGSTLYEKTVVCGALANAGWRDVPHGISNLGDVVYLGGTAIASNNAIPIPYTRIDGANYQVRLYIDATNIHIVTATDMTAYTKSYITVQYTKTT